MSDPNPSPRQVRAVNSDRIELVDALTGDLVAVARKVAGRDTWIVRRQGVSDAEWIEGDLAARGRLHEIGEQQ